MKYTLLILSAILFTFSSCKKDEVTPDATKDTKFKVAQIITSNNSKIELFANDSLRAGYQQLYFKISNAAGANISDANLSLATEMVMTMMTHSSPSEQPIYNSVSGYYEGAAIFTMPSGTDSWKLKLKMNGENYNLPIDVLAPKSKLVGSYTGLDGNRYVVAIVPNKTWTVGLNNLEVTVHKMADMMNFPPQNDLTIQLTPEMPSMGHGSPNNTDPVYVSNGHYKGKVNLTMTGDWRFHLKISKNGTDIISDATIDIFF